jgi:hypothetical protein
MTALEEYYNEFVTMPDFDLSNEINEILFFREGGFVRFTPKFPDGGPVGARFFNVGSEALPGIAMPQIRQPQYDDVQHINAATGAVGTFVQARQGQERLKMQKEEFAHNKEMNMLNLEMRKSEFELSKDRFAHAKMIDNFTMMNTIKDNLTGIELLPEDMKIYQDKLNGQNWGELFQLATSGENPDAMSQLQKAATNILMDKDLIAAQARKKKFHADQALIKNMDPVLVQSFSNYPEVMAARLNGEPAPEFDISPENMEAYRTYKSQLREAGLAEAQTQVELNKANAVKARAAGYEAQVDADIAKEDYDYYRAEIAEIEAGDHNPEEKRKLIEKARMTYKGKTGTSGNSAVSNPNTMGGRMVYYQSLGYSLEESRKMAHEDERIANSNSMNYNGLNADGTPAAGNTMVAQGLGAELNKKVYTSGFTYQDITVDNVIASELSRTVNAIKPTLNFKAVGPNGDTFTIPVDEYEGSYEFEAIRLKANPNGSSTEFITTGNILTTEEDMADDMKKKGFKVEEVPSTRDDGPSKYRIFNVQTTLKQEDLGYSSAPQPSTASTTSTTGASGVARKIDDKLVPANVGFKSDSLATQFTQKTLDAFGSVPVPVVLSKGTYHEGRENIDVGLAATGKQNAQALQFFASEEGMGWAIENGYEIQYETGSEEEAKHEPKIWHGAMETTVNTKRGKEGWTGTHLNFQTYDKTIYFYDDNSLPHEVRARFENGKYIVTGIPGASEPEEFSPKDYLWLIKDATIFESKPN